MLRDHLPEADGPLLSMRVCLYTNSPDTTSSSTATRGTPGVTLACGFSGHGFKFATGLGEALAELTLNGRTTLPIGFLGLRRFGAGG
jgi:glycine/D-amino acid oxidase-like deaminating enzyme